MTCCKSFFYIDSYSFRRYLLAWFLLDLMFCFSALPQTTSRTMGIGLVLLLLFSPPAPSVTIYDYFSLEKGDLRVKTEALKKVIQQILNGDKMPSLLMVIIKFLMPLDDHTIKKLLLIFWEIVPKTGQDGKLLQEMILVCDAYRKVKALIMIENMVYCT